MFVLQVHDAAVRIRLIMQYFDLRYSSDYRTYWRGGVERGEGCHSSDLLCWLEVIWSGAPTDSISVADPDPGSGIRCLFDPWIRDPEWVFSGSRIPRPYFEELFDNFLGKKFYNSLKIGPNFFL